MAYKIGICEIFEKLTKIVKTKGKIKVKFQEWKKISYSYSNLGVIVD